MTAVTCYPRSASQNFSEGSQEDSGTHSVVIIPSPVLTPNLPTFHPHNPTLSRESVASSGNLRRENLEGRIKRVSSAEESAQLLDALYLELPHK